MGYNILMNERQVQKILYKQLVIGRNSYNIAIPNIYLFDEQESDFVGITKSGYAHEYEIKLNKADYLNDFKKPKHNHLLSYWRSPSPGNIPRRFYFVIHGFTLFGGELPDYAGLIAITERGIMKTIRRAPDLSARKLDEAKLIKIATSLSYRLWKTW
jgi:hypothetical protein